MSPEKRLHQATNHSNPVDPTAYLRRTFGSGVVLSGGAGSSTVLRGVFIIKGNTAGFTELHRNPGESIETFAARSQKILETEFQDKVNRVQNQDDDRKFLASFVAMHNCGLQPEE